MGKPRFLRFGKIRGKFYDNFNRNVDTTRMKNILRFKNKFQKYFLDPKHLFYIENNQIYNPKNKWDYYKEGI